MADVEKGEDDDGLAEGEEEAVALAVVEEEPHWPSMPALERPISISPYVDEGFAGFTNVWRTGCPL